MSGRTWFLAFISVLATALGIVSYLGDGVAAGIRSFLIVAVFWTVISFSRSDWLAQLRAGEHQDERQGQIGIEALAVTACVLVAAALSGGMYETAQGRSGPYSVMCVVAGATFLLASVLLPRRR